MRICEVLDKLFDCGTGRCNGWLWGFARLATAERPIRSADGEIGADAAPSMSAPS
jgi:hypothetical protein